MAAGKLSRAASFLHLPTITLNNFKKINTHTAGLLNFFISGGFERNIPAMVEWFAGQQL
ncbi:MAG TPA: hypothetical protein PKD90_18805 [Phnomibacter sp.]|nr:hypothetical protein [Phnomibacter sp.]